MKYFFAFLLLLCGLGGSSVSGASYNFSERHGKRQITFESKAPTEYIEGTVSRIEGQVELDASRSDLGLKGSVHIPVDAMETGHGQRDEHLRSPDWMNANLFPTIRFVLDPLAMADITKRGPQKWFVQAKGYFVMKGVSKKISTPVTLELKKEGGQEKLFLQGRFSLKLSDFGIRGPSAVRMIGVRVSDTVNINFKLVGVQDPGWGQTR